MKDTPLQLQIYYELALAIGNGTELALMLKQSLSAYLRKLNCSAGMVLGSHCQDDGSICFAPLLTLPKRMDKNPAIQHALSMLPQTGGPNALGSCLAQLPMKVTAETRMQIHLMALPSFGVLLLVKGGEPLPDQVIKSLQPINQKLADACHACIQNKKIEQLVVQLQHEVEERAEAQRKLSRSKQKYQNIFENI